MKLILITCENFFEGETEAVNQLFETGLQILHLRKPNAKEISIREFMEKIDPSYHKRIVLADCYAIEKRFEIKGIHINRRNIKDEVDLLDFLMTKERGNLTISCSCHSIEELEYSKWCDYVFLSPLFDSISKPGYQKRFTEAELKIAGEKNIINEKIIGLGGITAENIPLVHGYGFGGVAVSGALWGNYPERGNINEVLERFKGIERAVNKYGYI